MNTGSGTDIARAGWLYRQSTFLHRWKRNWFVLYQDGLLRYFESQESPRAEEVFILRSVCRQIKTGPQVRSTNPPEEVREGKFCMFELEMTDGNHLMLCADTADDMRAWQYALDEARAMSLSHPGTSFGPGNPSPVPIGYTYQQIPYGGYPGQVISRTPQAQLPAQVVHGPNGTTTIINQAPPPMVVVDDSHDRCRYGHRGHCCHNRGTTYVATPRYW